MKFLGFSDRRRWKLSAPLLSIDDGSHVVDADRSRSFCRYLMMLYKGHQEIQESEPEVLIVNGDGIAAAITVLLGIVHKTPVIIHLVGDVWKNQREMAHDHRVNGNVRQYAKYRLLTAMNRRLFNHIDGVFAVSESVRKSVLLNTNISPNCIELVHTPLDYGNFLNNESTSTATASTGMTLLTVTNLEYKSKLDAIIDAFPAVSEVLKKRPELSFVIAGGGHYHSDLVEYIRFTITDPSIRQRIHLVGYVEDIAMLYQNSDIFLYFSYSDGYPSVVLEAQATALPVITNDEVGMLDQICHGNTGILVDIHENRNVEFTILELLDNKGKRQQLGERAKQKIIEENSPDAIGKQMKNSASVILSESTTQ